MAHASHDKSLSEKPTTEALSTLQMGIWQFSTPKETGWSFGIRWDEVRSTWTLLRRLALEIYALCPGLLVLFVLSKIWGGVEDALLMHLSSRLLRIVSHPNYLPGRCCDECSDRSWAEGG